MSKLSLSRSTNSILLDPISMPASLIKIPYINFVFTGADINTRNENMSTQFQFFRWAKINLAHRSAFRVCMIRQLNERDTLLVPTVIIFEVFKVVLRERGESAALQAPSNRTQSGRPAHP